MTKKKKLEGRLVALLVGGVRYPAPVLGPGDANGPDGAVEGNAGHHQRGRGGGDGQHVVRVLLVVAEDRAHHVDLVAKAGWERGSQRPVDEPAGQDRLIGGPTFATEERPGDLFFFKQKTAYEVHS